MHAEHCLLSIDASLSNDLGLTNHNAVVSLVPRPIPTRREGPGDEAMVWSTIYKFSDPSESCFSELVGSINVDLHCMYRPPLQKSPIQLANYVGMHVMYISY